MRTREAGFHGKLLITLLLLERNSVWKLPFKIARRLICQALYNCEIHPSSFVSDNALRTLRLPHPFLIIIHRDAIICENVTIFHNVTLGATEGRRAGVPKIRSGATLGTGVTVLGPVDVGSRAVLGAGALILKDVHDEQRVVGVHK